MAELPSDAIRFPALAARKDLFDTVNSLSWFFMDACWMVGLYSAAFFLAPFVVLSSIALVVIDRRPAFVAINLGILSWVFMNLTWMLSDVGERDFWLLVSRGFFAAGLVTIGAAVTLSKNLRETFSQFRRFRIKDWA